MSKLNIYAIREAYEIVARACESRFVNPHDRAQALAYVKTWEHKLDDALTDENAQKPPRERLKEILQEEYKDQQFRTGSPQRLEKHTAELKLFVLSLFAHEINIHLKPLGEEEAEFLRQATQEAKRLEKRILAPASIVKETVTDITNNLAWDGPYRNLVILTLTPLLSGLVEGEMVDVGDFSRRAQIAIRHNLKPACEETAETLRWEKSQTVAALEQLDVKDAAKAFANDLADYFGVVGKERFRETITRFTDAALQDVSSMKLQYTQNAGRNVYLNSPQQFRFRAIMNQVCEQFSDGDNPPRVLTYENLCKNFPDNFRNLAKRVYVDTLVELGYRDHIQDFFRSESVFR